MRICISYPISSPIGPILFSNSRGLSGLILVGKITCGQRTQLFLSNSSFLTSAFFMDFHGFSMDFHEFSIDFHGFSLIFHRFSWIFHGFPWQHHQIYDPKIASAACLALGASITSPTNSSRSRCWGAQRVVDDIGMGHQYLIWIMGS